MRFSIRPPRQVRTVRKRKVANHAVMVPTRCIGDFLEVDAALTSAHFKGRRLAPNERRWERATRRARITDRCACAFPFSANRAPCGPCIPRSIGPAVGKVAY